MDSSMVSLNLMAKVSGGPENNEKDRWLKDLREEKKKGRKKKGWLHDDLAVHLSIFLCSYLCFTCFRSLLTVIITIKANCLSLNAQPVRCHGSYHFHKPVPGIHINQCSIKQKLQQCITPTLSARLHHLFPNLPLPLALEFLFLMLSFLKLACAVALIFLAAFLTMPSLLELFEASSLSVVVVFVNCRLRLASVSLYAASESASESMSFKA